MAEHCMTNDTDHQYQYYRVNNNRFDCETCAQLAIRARKVGGCWPDYQLTNHCAFIKPTALWKNNYTVCLLAYRLTFIKRYFKTLLQ